MRKSIIFCLVLFVSSVINIVFAGIDRASSTSGLWEGIWKDDKTGNTVSIREKQGFLDFSGKDSKSVYRGVCLIDATTHKKAICMGEGMNQEGDFRFLYKSTLTLSEPNTLSEVWKASFVKGEISGNSSFDKVKF